MREAVQFPTRDAANQPLKQLAHWLVGADGAKPPLVSKDVLRLVAQAIARIDEMIGRQLDAILHHPDFQKLEASWRGLHYLVQQAPEGGSVKIRALHVSWRDLCRDLERAMEFDQSQIFYKVYEEEFGSPGGQPFAGQTRARLGLSPTQAVKHSAGLNAGCCSHKIGDAMHLEVCSTYARPTHAVNDLCTHAETPWWSQAETDGHGCESTIYWNTFRRDGVRAVALGRGCIGTVFRRLRCPRRLEPS